jgi:hypothetical protein
MKTAAQRSQASARRLLARYGSLMTFQLYEPTKDKRQGSQALAASGAAVQARACLLDAEESRDRGVQAGDQVLLADGTPFGTRELTDRWRVDWGAGPRRISGPVVAARSAPGQPVAYFEAMVRTGGKEPAGVE